MAVAIERAERGGSSSDIRIGDQLSPTQRTTVERIEASLGSSPGTIMLGGRRVSLEESQTLGVIEQQIQSTEQTKDT